jgi:hypothetical protein
MSPREYTLHRLIILGLDIKAREGRDSHKVEVLRTLYLELKQDQGNAAPHFLKIRKSFIGLDLIHFDRILVDETSIVRLMK